MKTTVMTGAATAALTIGAFFGMQSEEQAEGPILAAAARTFAMRSDIDQSDDPDDRQGLISSENGAQSGITANRVTAGAWEQFEICNVLAVTGVPPRPIHGNGGIDTRSEAAFNSALKGNNGKFVSSENGFRAMRCDRNAAQAWETFSLSDTSSRTLIIRGTNGKYVSSENGAAPLRCNRTIVGGWEHFRFE